MLTKDEIEAALGKVHHLRDPTDIYVFDQPIRADRLHEAYPTDCSSCESMHRFNAEVRGHKWHIYGVTPRPGARTIFLAGDAPVRTLYHEDLHSNGLGSEAAAHAIAPVMVHRFRHRSLRRPREVRYVEVPVSSEEKRGLLRGMKLKEEGPETVNITHYRLVGVEGTETPSAGARPSMDLLYDPRYDLLYDPEG